MGNAFPAITPTTASVGDPRISIPDAEAALASSCAATPCPGLLWARRYLPPNALSLKLLPLYVSNNTNAGTVAFGFPNVVSSNNVVGKVDYHASDHHTFAETLAREISGGVLRAALKAMR